MSIARFGRISETQYSKDMAGMENPMPLREIPLPRRATAGSAGYDFVSPADIVIPGGGRAVIPSGIRCEMQEGWVLMLFPRSGLGFKTQIRLSNTVGIIDSDYAQAENEGHIIVSLRNPLDREIRISKGERFCQGVFLPYGLAEEGDHFAERKGGMGSTGMSMNP